MCNCKKDELKGNIPVGIIVLDENKKDICLDKLSSEMIRKIKEDIGNFACFNHCIFIKSIPKNQNGKVMREILRSMVNLEDFEIPNLAENPTLINEINEVIKKFFTK